MENFKVSQELFGSLPLIKIINTNNKEYVSILPSVGGMLLNLELLIGSKMISVLETYSSEEELNEILGNSFKGSLLFPFPNRIGDGTYKYKGKDYALPINFPNEHNAIHGLVYNKELKLTNTELTEEYGQIELTYVSDTALSGYPFKFELTTLFRLDIEGIVTITNKVKNSDSNSIPIGIGWHPYFSLGESVDNLKLAFPAKELFKVDGKMLPTGETENYNAFNELNIIGNTQFDTCFSIDLEHTTAEVLLLSNALNAGIKIWHDTGKDKYNFLQVYTPPHRNSIAIEPMTCLPNAFNSERGFQELEPGETMELSWGISKQVI